VPEPVVAEQPEPPAADPQPAGEAQQAEAEPEPAQSAQPPAGLAKPATPAALLANLAALADEDAQAEAKPELWEVIRAVRAQIKRCWLINPAESRNPKLSVEIAVAFDRGGALLKAQVLGVARMVQDEEFKAFAVSAHGALEACSPFELPTDRYDIWRAFTMRFVPREPS
jgi:outer membrane biosynthesis protein TonB